MTTMPEHLNMDWVDSIKVSQSCSVLGLYFVLPIPNHNADLTNHLLHTLDDYFSMFLSISLKERQGRNLNAVRHR